MLIIYGTETSEAKCEKSSEGLDTLAGWWLGHPSEKYEFVNWDDEIPNISGKIPKMATKPPTSACFFLHGFGSNMGKEPSISLVNVNIVLVNWQSLTIKYGRLPRKF